MSDLSEFLSMGGYGAYVWSAYAITFVVLIANVLVTRHQYRQAKLLVARRAHQKKAKKT